MLDRLLHGLPEVAPPAWAGPVLARTTWTPEDDVPDELPPARATRAPCPRDPALAAAVDAAIRAALVGVMSASNITRATGLPRQAVATSLRRMQYRGDVRGLNGVGYWIPKTTPEEPCTQTSGAQPARPSPP